MRIKELVKRSIQSRTLLQDIIGFGLIKIGFADKYLSGLVTMYKSYDWLRKQFRNEINISDYENIEQLKIESEKVWICWFQGLENAPHIVKQCVESARYWMPDKEIVIITAENMKQYVDFPDHIIDKWKKGYISNTHLSDLLRLELLIRHGGLWLDATTYFTGKVPGYIMNHDFFVYRNGWMNQEMINMGSWLMYSKKTNNPILILTRDLLYKYWDKYDYLKNYFLMHMFFRMASDELPVEWEAVPMINHFDCHLLMNELEKDFNYERVKEIVSISSIHKLTYKFKDALKENSTANHLGSIFMIN